MFLMYCIPFVGFCSVAKVNGLTDLNLLPTGLQYEKHWHKIQNLLSTLQPIKRLLLVRQLRLFLGEDS